MTEKVVDTFIRYQIKRGMILDEDVSVYRYGYMLLLETAVNIILSVGIGFVMNDVLSVLIFLLSFMTLRSYAGGYHANRTWKCMLLSNFCVFITLLLGSITNSLNCTGILLVLDAFASISIYLLAPVSSENKILSSNERKVYKKVVFYILIFQLAMWFLLHDKAVAIFLAHIIVLVSMLAANHCNRRKNVLSNSKENLLQ